MFVLKFTFLLISTCHLLANAQNLFTGDSCTLRDGVPGTCRPMTECQFWIQQSQQQQIKQRPVICSFTSRVPVVCCPLEVTSTSTTTTSVTPTLSPPPDSPEDPPVIGETSLSEQKCQEYAKAVYELKPDESSNVNRSTCGALTPIINGESVQCNEYPHMALLGYGSVSSLSWLCSGSLISEKWVLTAAHCLQSASEGDVKFVRLGEVGTSNPNECSQPQMIAVTERIPHPKYLDYWPPSSYNDIGLIKLAQNAIFTASVRPACLHRDNALPNDGVGIQLIATGWGHNGNNEATRLQVSLTPVSHAKCNREYWNETISLTSHLSDLREGIDDESMICVDNERSENTCQGDSGGPLQYLRDAPYCMYYVVGVTAKTFGNYCTTRRPAVYTRVYKFIDWIEQTVWLIDLIWPDN